MVNGMGYVGQTKTTLKKRMNHHYESKKYDAYSPRD